MLGGFSIIPCALVSFSCICQKQLVLKNLYLTTCKHTTWIKSHYIHLLKSKDVGYYNGIEKTINANKTFFYTLPKAKD